MAAWVEEVGANVQPKRGSVRSIPHDRIAELGHDVDRFTYQISLGMSLERIVKLSILGSGCE